ncbi:MAG: pyruvate formate-lyase-activating protein [Clostridia bacterium]|nr:pyruvate formate-lyase-activating protein [Clostridia bacterium]
MKGNIHSFQSLGTLDGPGVRFVVFLHGCPLHCGYCHNIDVCRGDYQQYTPHEVLTRLLHYREYFGDEGGVTLSGGEPLLQSEFAAELFYLCKQQGISTVLDTSGCLWSSSAEQVLAYCDLVLLDLKMTKEEDYQREIGCSLTAPLFFLEQLEQRKIPCWIRHVVVEGLNDRPENIRALRALTQGKQCVQKIELLPFRKLCASKYQMLGIPFPFQHFSETSQKTIEELNQILNEK